MTNRTNARTRLILSGLILGLAVVAAVVVGEPGRRISYTGSAHPGSDTTMLTEAGRPVQAMDVAARLPADPLAFTDAEGRALTLADFRGKVVLVNLWATWCGPCVAEMPALDALQAKLGGQAFQVVAIALDRGGPEVAKRWLAKAGLSHLALYNGDAAKYGAALLPTSILLDRDGRVAWRGLGARPWDQPEAQAEIEKLMASGG